MTLLAAPRPALHNVTHYTTASNILCGRRHSPGYNILVRARKQRERTILRERIEPVVRLYQHTWVKCREKIVLQMWHIIAPFLSMYIVSFWTFVLRHVTQKIFSV